MKSLNIYINEKLKISKNNISNQDISFYELMQKLLNIAHSSVLFDEDRIHAADLLFDEHPKLKDFCIQYINNHDECPEMLDETTQDILGYFSDFPKNEFEKYLK